MSVARRLGIFLLVLILVVIAVFFLRFSLGRQEVDKTWQVERYGKLENLGSVKQLSILPLVDWNTANANLTGEAGVSYLIRADDTTILFDLGLNEHQEHPSPLLRNMAALGVNVNDVDAIFISHPHPDHLGGVRQGFAQLIDTQELKVFAPVPFEFPTAQFSIVDQPQVIAPGIASLGAIVRQDFFMGRILEQSLAINLEGKGIVLIVGCGHPTLQRILERAEMLFDEPIYGVVGGLHYPVTGSRLVRFGLPMQRILGTGKWPWNPINQQDVETALASLQARQPKLVALSAHDSCDWSIATFRKTFGDAYQELSVGREIVMPASPSLTKEGNL